MSAAKSLEGVHQRPTNQCSPSSYLIRKYPKLHHVRFVYKHDKHGFCHVHSETEKMFYVFCLNLYIYGLKLIVIWEFDVKLVDRQFPAGQNQDDRQVGIFGRDLLAAGRQIRALLWNKFE